MLKFNNISQNAIEKIKSYRYDRIIEKHEGPGSWDSVLEYYQPEFIDVNGKSVLLPIDQEHHKNITILRVIVEQEDKSLTIFLKDTTYVENTQDEFFSAGFMAVCDKVPGEEFFIAIVYHEWFIINENIDTN